MRLALVFYATLAILAVAWRVGWFGENLLLAAPGASIRWLPAVGLGALAAALTIGASGLLSQHTELGRKLARALAEALPSLSPAQCVVLALASGVAEEAFFRGALQPRVGLLWASGIFALAHFVPRRELAIWSLFSLLAGLMLGGLFELTGNLVAPVVAHVGINAVNLNRLVREYGPGPSASPITSPRSPS